MTARLWLKLVALALLYSLCVIVWTAEQSLGLGRNFLYSIF